MLHINCNQCKWAFSSNLLSPRWKLQNCVALIVLFLCFAGYFISRQPLQTQWSTPSDEMQYWIQRAQCSGQCALFQTPISHLMLPTTLLGSISSSLWTQPVSRCWLQQQNAYFPCPYSIKKHACLLRPVFSQSQEHGSNFVSSGMSTWSRRPAEAQTDYQYYPGKNSVLSDWTRWPHLLGADSLNWGGLQCTVGTVWKHQRILSISNCSFHWRSQTLLINLPGLQQPASLLDHRPRMYFKSVRHT